MNDLKKFLRSTGVYLVGTVATRAIWLVLVPLYSHVVPPADYGTYDINVAMVTLLSSVIYLEIWNAVLRFMFDHSDMREKGGPVVAGCALFGASSVVLAGVMLLINAVLPVEHVGYVFLYGLCTNLCSMSGYIARGYNKSLTFMLSGVVGALVTVALNLVLLLGLGMGYQALYLSFALGQLVGTAVNVFGGRLWRQLRGVRFSGDTARAMVRYALPLAVNSIAYWFLTSYNKVAITGVLGADANGLYAMAGKFAIIITLVTQAFQLAWAELSFSKAGEDRDKLGAFYSRATEEYVRFMALSMALLMPLIRLAWPLMVGGEYAAAIGLVPLYMVATLVSVYCSFLTSMFATIKDTKSVLYTTALGSVANVACVHLLLPVLGLQAANVALLLGFSVDLGLRLWLLHRKVGLSIHWGRQAPYLLAVVAACALFLLGGTVANALGAVAIAALVLFIYRDRLRALLSRNGQEETEDL